MVSVVVVSVDVRRGRRSGPDDEVRDVFSVAGMQTAFRQSGVCLRYGWAGVGFSGPPFAPPPRLCIRPAAGSALAEVRSYGPENAPVWPGRGYTEAYRRTSQM